ncbi:pyridoxamine 5'-phosphate oxidase family protein [Amnibacterium sp.]|uniref:pyridoxamine 5'-phosphate oxidase family protein n=1 Tax=Amnibacterium sp. TaxID=1872496 RepID=UPI003F7C6050
MHAPTRRERPDLPPGYGLPDTDEGLLEWAAVEDRLVAARHYWMATVRPDGRPHLIPRWGVWLEGRFYYDGSPATRHARNLAANPACSLALEDGAHAVIVEGRSDPARAEAKGLGRRLADAFGKYHAHGYAPTADAWEGSDGGGLRVLRPRIVLAWFDYPRDATRFVFAD